MKVHFFKLKEDDIIAYSLVKASWLQKCVRRNLSDKAVSIGKVYLDENQQKGLIRKLLVFCAEDIGLGYPNAIVELKQIKDPLNQVEFLCKLTKNREADKFLYQVENNYENIKDIPEIEKEVKSLKLLLSIASTWFNNKRLKKNKENLYKMFEVLENNCHKEHNKKIIRELVDAYFELSKNNSFGTKNLLAMIVLISIRDMDLPPSIKVDYNAKIIDIDEVDDFAMDKHTSFGKSLNRGFEHWVIEGSVVFPEVDYPELYLINNKVKYTY